MSGTSEKATTMELKSSGDKMKENAAGKDVDGGWAWVVFIGTLFNTMIYFGQLTSGPIYFVIFLEEFKGSQSYTAWIIAAQSAAFCGAGPLSSFLLGKIGPRALITMGSILYCITFCSCYLANSIPFLILSFAVAGASCSFIHTGDLAAITSFFQKKAYALLGLMFGGAGIGGMIFALEVEWAVETYGWRGAMLLQAGLVLNICIGAAVVFKRPKSITNNNVSVDKEPPKESNWKTIKSYAGDVRLWLICVSTLMMNFTLSTMMPLMKNIVIHNGLGDYYKYAVIAYGVGGCIGRGFVGLFSHKLCPPITAMTASFLGAIANICFIPATELWIMCLANFTFSLFLGALTVVSLLQIGWVYGPKNIASIGGYTFIFCLITTFTGAPVAGYTVDLTGNYNIAITMCSVSSFIGAISSLALYIVHRRRLTSNIVTESPNAAP